MQYVLTLGIFLLLFLGYFHKITAITQDLGRHLLTGKIIVKTHTVPKENLFSYTYPHFPFVNHHWFSEVIFYLWYKVTGFNGLLLLTCFSILLSFALLFIYAKKRTSMLAIMFASLFYLPILFERTDIRPEIFSFLLLSSFMVILYKFRETYTKWIFILIPLELLWVNLHIYFPIGIAVIGLFFGEEILFIIIPQVFHLTLPSPQGEDKFLLPREKIKMRGRIENSKKKLTLFFTLISCCLVTLCNPNGIKGALYPFQVFQNYGYSIEENQNVFFLQQLYSHESILFFFITVVLLFIFLIACNKKTKLVDWFLAVFFTYLGASAIRSLPLFVFGTFLIFCTNFSLILDKVLPLFCKRFSPKIINIFLYSVLLLAIISQCFLLCLNSDTGFGMVTGAQPATEFFIRNHLHGPIFNNFDIGSYLEYRLYPHEKVFVDGRPEAYPKDFFQKVYIPMQQDEKIFSGIDKKYHFNSIFFSYTDQTPWAHSFLQTITHNPSWSIVYIDNYIIILVKNISSNKNLIKKYAISEKTFHTTEKDQKNLLRYAYLVNTIGWSSQEGLIYQAMLSENPQNCDALYNLTILYIKQNNPAKNIYAQKTQTFCPDFINR